MIDSMLIATAGADDEMERLIRVVLEGEPSDLVRFSAEIGHHGQSQSEARSKGSPSLQLVARLNRASKFLSEVDDTSADTSDFWTAAFNRIQRVLERPGRRGPHPSPSMNTDQQREDNLSRLARTLEDVERRDPPLGQYYDIWVLGGLSRPGIARLMGISLKALHRRLCAARKGPPGKLF